MLEAPAPRMRISLPVTPMTFVPAPPGMKITSIQGFAFSVLALTTVPLNGVSSIAVGTGVAVTGVCGFGGIGTT